MQSCYFSERYIDYANIFKAKLLIGIKHDNFAAKDVQFYLIKILKLENIVKRKGSKRKKMKFDLFYSWEKHE